MNPVLIDTSAWIESLRSRGDIDVRKQVSNLLTDGRACLNELILAELWNGAQGNAEKKMIKALEDDLLIFTINSAVWQLAYKISEKARSQGKTIPTTDIIVFACSRHHKTGLFHNDKHFDLLVDVNSQ